MFKKGDRAYHKIRGVVTITEDERQDKYFIGCDFTANGIPITGCQLAKVALRKIGESLANYLVISNIGLDEYEPFFMKNNTEKKLVDLKDNLLYGLKT